ncbi:hypothetical protein PAL_GLEAN10025292 [Pteropus alecto]|uniref:Uncharacterized protein n=1 Tax=Pteropus alecto TaxID=9402 RepID=L5JML9_PTEAL|nr:hypothetical protein PAL_GLEAN10025292 [Pteropus alecto]
MESKRREFLKGLKSDSAMGDFSEKKNLKLLSPTVSPPLLVLAVGPSNRLGWRHLNWAYLYSLFFLEYQMNASSLGLWGSEVCGFNFCNPLADL